MNENKISWQTTGKEYSVTIIRQKNGECSSCSSSSANYIDVEDEVERDGKASSQWAQVIVKSSQLDETITETVISNVMHECWTLSSEGHSHNTLIERPPTRTIDSSVDLLSETMKRKPVVDDASDFTVQWILANELQTIENCESESSSAFLFSSKSMSTRSNEGRIRTKTDWLTSSRPGQSENMRIPISPAPSMTTLTPDVSNNHYNLSLTPGEIFLSKFGRNRNNKQFIRNNHQSGSPTLDDRANTVNQTTESHKTRSCSENISSASRSTFNNTMGKEAPSIIPVISLSYPKFIDDFLSNKTTEDSINNQSTISSMGRKNSHDEPQSMGNLDGNDNTSQEELSINQDVFDKNIEPRDRKSRTSSTADSDFSNLEAAFGGKNRNAAQPKHRPHPDPSPPGTENLLSDPKLSSEAILYLPRNESSSLGSRDSTLRDDQFSDSPSLSGIEEDFPNIQATKADKDRKAVQRKQRHNLPSFPHKLENSLSNTELPFKANIDDKFSNDFYNNHEESQPMSSLNRNSIIQQEESSINQDVFDKNFEPTVRKSRTSSTEESDFSNLEASFAGKNRNAAQGKHRPHQAPSPPGTENLLSDPKLSSEPKLILPSESLNGNNIAPMEGLSINQDVFDKNIEPTDQTSRNSSTAESDFSNLEASFAGKNRNAAQRKHRPPPGTKNVLSNQKLSSEPRLILPSTSLNRNNIAPKEELSMNEDVFDKNIEETDQKPRTFSTTESDFSNLEASFSGKNRNAAQRKHRPASGTENLLSNQKLSSEATLYLPPESYQIKENLENRGKQQNNYLTFDDSSDALSRNELSSLGSRNSTLRDDHVSHSPCLSGTDEDFPNIQATDAGKDRKAGQRQQRHNLYSSSTNGHIQPSTMEPPFKVKFEDSSSRNVSLSQPSSIYENTFSIPNTLSASKGKYLSNPSSSPHDLFNMPSPFEANLKSSPLRSDRFPQSPFDPENVSSNLNASSAEKNKISRQRNNPFDSAPKIRSSFHPISDDVFSNLDASSAKKDRNLTHRNYPQHPSFLSYEVDSKTSTLNLGNSLHRRNYRLDRDVSTPVYPSSPSNLQPSSSQKNRKSYSRNNNPGTNVSSSFSKLRPSSTGQFEISPSKNNGHSQATPPSDGKLPEKVVDTKNAKSNPPVAHRPLTHYSSVEEVLQKFSKTAHVSTYIEEEHKENTTFDIPQRQQEPPIRMLQEENSSLKDKQRADHHSLKKMQKKVDKLTLMLQSNTQKRVSRRPPLIANHEVLPQMIDVPRGHHVDFYHGIHPNSLEGHGCYYCARNCPLLRNDYHHHNGEFTPIDGRHTPVIGRSRSREHYIPDNTRSRSQYSSPSRSMREMFTYEDPSEHCSICGIQRSLTGSDGRRMSNQLEHDMRVHADYLIDKYVQPAFENTFINYP